MTELERLRDRVEELEELLGLRFVAPSAFNIGSTPEKMLGLLRKCALVTPELFFRALYGGKDEPKTINYMAAIVYRLNKALKPYDIAIRCDRGRGYFLDAKGKSALDRLLAGGGGASEFSHRRNRYSESDLQAALARYHASIPGTPFRVAANDLETPKHHRPHPHAS